MSDRNKKIRNRFTDFLRYYRNDLSEKERNSFERELQKDPFAEEALEGFASVSDKEVSKDISDLQRRIKTRTTQRQRFIIYRISASIAVFMAIAILYTYIGRNKPVKTFADNSVQADKLEIIKLQPLKQSTAKEGIPVEKMLDTEKKAERSSLQKRSTEAVGNIENLENLSLSEAPRNDSISDIINNRFKADIKMQQMVAPVNDLAKERSVSSYNFKGKIVSSEDNLSVPGANVIIKGTKTGVVTDIEGNFNINLPDSNKRTLTANFIGMEPREFVTKADSEVQVRLDPSVSSLSEVVVVGYSANKNKVAGEENIGNHTPPEPVVGKSNFDKYIQNNLHRPDSVTSGQRVVVVVSFLVHSDGSIDSIRIVRSPGKIFSDEVMRAIKSGPLWKPAEDNGKPVEDVVRLRIVFK